MAQCNSTFRIFNACAQTLLASYYQLFSVWTFVATAAMTYEISRMRFYFAKHAFRIHKLSNLHISTQVTKHLNTFK